MPLFCLYLGVSLVFPQVFGFIYGAFWISIEAENVAVEVAVVFVGRYLQWILGQFTHQALQFSERLTHFLLIHVAGRNQAHYSTLSIAVE